MNTVKKNTIEIPDIDRFVEDAGGVVETIKRSDKPRYDIQETFSELSQLDTDQLMDRLGQVDNQATLLKWRIWWAIRQRFKSDKLFGQYIAGLKNTPYAGLVGSQQQINRALNAGRFCERNNITDLAASGLYQSSIYALSRPMNDDVADKVYREMGKDYLPVYEVERLIAQAKAVLTIEQAPPVVALKPEAMAREVPKKRIIVVNNNIAQLEEPKATPTSDDDEDSDITFKKPAADISDEEIATEIMGFLERYKRSPIRLIPVFQKCIEIARDRMYPKKR